MSMSLRAARDEGTFQRGEKLKKTEKLHKGARQPPPPLAGRRPPRYSQDEPREKPIGKGFDKIQQRQQPRGRSRAKRARPNPFPTGSINPNKPQRRARDGGTTENHSQRRDRDAPGGRHVALIRRGRGRALARDERRCADALNRLDSDERTLVSIEGVSNGKPSMEAEPMRGRTSTPAAGRQGTGKGGVKRRAILRPGFSLAMKFLSLVICDFALYRGKVYRTFAAK